jgi:hypothetical protein
MNDREFEDKLRKLAAGWVRRDRTSTWKTDMLAKAHRARTALAPRAPFWLLAILGASWVLIAALRFTTPAGAGAPASTRHETEAVSPEAHSFRASLIPDPHPDLIDLP